MMSTGAAGFTVAIDGDIERGTDGEHPLRAEGTEFDLAGEAADGGRARCDEGAPQSRSRRRESTTTGRLGTSV